jgi:PadR family transcriptional regulator
VRTLRSDSGNQIENGSIICSYYYPQGDSRLDRLLQDLSPVDNGTKQPDTTYQASREGCVAKSKQRSEGELVQGTLDMLIMKTLSRGAMHGYGIAQSIHRLSDEVLRVEEGSLYPALHRLELDGMLDSEWGVSENNRRAKYYRLSAPGRKRLEQEAANWNRVAFAIARIMETA